MKVITFANQKGGVGKSALCTMAARYLAAAKKRVLILDSDPQCSVTQSYISDSSYVENNLVHAITKNDLRSNIVVVSEYISICPGIYSLDDVTNIQERKYKNLIVEVKEDFDFILIDTPGSINGFFYAGVVAADLVVIPFTQGNFSVLATRYSCSKIFSLDPEKSAILIPNMFRGKLEAQYNQEWIELVENILPLPGNFDLAIPQVKIFEKSMDTGEIMSDALNKQTLKSSLCRVFERITSINYEGAF